MGEARGDSCLEIGKTSYLGLALFQSLCLFLVGDL